MSGDDKEAEERVRRALKSMVRARRSTTDEMERVRGRVLGDLAALDPRAVLGAAQRVANEGKELHLESIYLLMSYADSGVVHAYLAKAFAALPDRERRTLVSILGRRSQDGGAFVVGVYKSDPDLDVRMGALLAAAHLKLLSFGHPAFLPLVRQLPTSPRERSTALVALSEDPTPAAAELCRRVLPTLRDDDDRLWALSVCATFGDNDACESLADMAGDPGAAI